MLSFPMPTLGAHPRGGCRLPDAILHGKRSFRPRSRAVQRLTATGFRVRLFSSLGLMVAPPACKPGQDTSATCSPRLDRLAPGQLLLLTGRSPGATGLASSLSGCFSLTGQRCVFCIAGVPEGFHGSCRDRVSFPVRMLHFVPPFDVFRLADPNRFRAARVIRPC